MKIKSLVAIIVVVAFTIEASAQSKKDSLRIRAELENIRTGKNLPLPKPDSPSTILRVRPAFPVKVDSNAVKPSLPSPTPPSPNNPNRNEPRPSPVHPHPPAEPPIAIPPVPPGTPRAPDK